MYMLQEKDCQENSKLDLISICSTPTKRDRTAALGFFEQPFARLGLFNLYFFAGENVCYFNRADEKQVFPSIGFKEDGSLDVENTVYYNKFL